MLQMELKRRDFGFDEQESSRDRFQRRKVAQDNFDDDDDDSDKYERLGKSR